MKLLHYSTFILTITFTFVVYVSQVQGEQLRNSSDVPAVFPTETRDNKLWRQDDHIHTTPDAAEHRFEVLDADNDRRLQWGEMQPVNMKREIFTTLDTDGSGDLDREEYIAVSPSPENDYSADAMAEP